MSPTTLYREGSDLDELLAELDSRYPGQVRVVEVTHPREGGVMGFFAKQRVGVHYRLIDEAATPRQTVISPASPEIRAARRAAADVPERAVAAVYDAAAGARTARPGTGQGGVGIAEQGFGPDLAAIRAALAHRSGVRQASSTAVGAAPVGAAPVPTRGTVVGGADIESRRSDQGAPAPLRESSFDQSLPHLASSLPADGSGAEPVTVPVAMPVGGFAGAPAAVSDRTSSASAPVADATVIDPSATAAPDVDAPGIEASGRRDAGQAGDPGLEFAKILADIAFHKSAAPGGGDIAADLAAVVTALKRGSLAASDMATAPAADVATAAVVPTTPSAADFTPLDGFATLVDAARSKDASADQPSAAARPTVLAESAALTQPGDAAREAGTLPEAAASATTAAATQPGDPATSGTAAAAPRRRKPRAVPKFLGADAASPAAAAALTAPAAEASLAGGAAALADHLLAGGAAAADPSSAATSVTAPVAAAGVLSAAALSAAATAARRTEHLNWPFATTADVAAPGAAAPAAAGTATATLPRPDQVEPADGTPADELGDATDDYPAHDHPADDHTSVPAAAEPTGFAATPAGSTVAQRIAETDRAVAASANSRRHELRRRLIEVGVPVDTVPTDAEHAYAAVETLVHDLAPAPALPSGAGQIVVLAGPARDVALTADALAAAPGSSFDAIWSYGCPAGLGTWRVNLSKNTLASATEARELARTLRADAAGATLVLVATDAPSFAEPPVAVLDALTPDAAWAVVDATRKPDDTRKALAALGHLDAVAVTGAEASGSPATVWDLGLPIAMVDGRPSSASAWAVLLVSKLSEIAEAEETACSAAAS